MATSLAVADTLPVTDPLINPAKPKPLGLMPPTPTPLPQSPGMAGGLPPLPSINPAIPTPTVAPPSAPVDRVKLATDIFNTSAASTQGAYDAASRDNIHTSAALGQTASGGLRTREGDLQLARGRDLDTLRAKLVNDATTGSIADATTAYQQGLASSQQELATELGKGNLAVAQGSLALEKEKAATGANQTQQQIDLAKKQADTQAALATAGLTGIINGTETLAAKQAAIQNAIQQGQLTIEQGQLALAQLSQATGAGQTQQQIDLAKKQQEIETAYQAKQISLAERNAALQELENTQQFGLATAGQDLQRQVQLGQLTIAQAQQQLDEKVRTGELTIEQARQQLAELSQSQTNTVQTGQLQLAKDQLAQTGSQFGLSLAQQKDLATLADKTSNRQLDIASAQGHDALLLELARIMGGSTGNVSPEFLAAVAQALGFAIPGNTPPPTTNPTVPPASNPYTPAPGTPGDKNRDNGGNATGSPIGLAA